MEKDTQELLRIKKKYSPKYILIVKLIECYIIFGILIAFSIVGRNFLNLICFVFILILIMLVSLVLGKKSAAKTYLAFYENKVIYKRKFLLRDTTRELNYDEIKDIVFTQGPSWFARFFQKRFKFGNVYVYPKKGNILTRGMQIEFVSQIDKVMVDIKTVVGDKVK